MANHLFGGYNSGNYGGAGSNLSSLYSSAADQYHPGDSASLLGATTARYLPSDPYSSSFSSSLSSLADRSSLYSDYLAGGYSRAGWPGPPGVEAGSSFPSVDAFAGYKRTSAAEGIDFIRVLYSSFDVLICGLEYLILCIMLCYIWFYCFVGWLGLLVIRLIPWKGLNRTINYQCLIVHIYFTMFIYKRVSLSLMKYWDVLDICTYQLFFLHTTACIHAKLLLKPLFDVNYASIF